MGLYGRVQADAGEGLAYAGVPYTDQVVLFYSEIDPDLHNAVASGTYGTANGPTSTIDYKPKYFLVNGQPYPNPNAHLASGTAGAPVLIRFLSTALKPHSIELLGGTMRLIAEDGNLYLSGAPVQ